MGEMKFWASIRPKMRRRMLSLPEGRGARSLYLRVVVIIRVGRTVGHYLVRPRAPYFTAIKLSRAVIIG